MSEHNLIEEYKRLYEDSRRDNDKFLQIMLTMKDVIELLKDNNKNLQDDNHSLRTQLSLINHRNLQQQQQRNDELPSRVSAFIDIIEDNGNMGSNYGDEMPRYSIPPHIRQVYLGTLEDSQCSICLEQINNNDTMQLTECGHIFHVDCIRRHRRNNDNCPVCRSNL